MARLNTRLSATPIPGRSSTVDSLYRDPTPASQLHGGSTIRASSYSVMSPARSMNSDKENEQPDTRENTPPTASKGRTMADAAAQRMPTPTSGSSSDHPNKRRRTDDYSIADSPIYRGGPINIQVHEDGNEEQETEQDVATTPEEDEDEETRYYDPNQNPELRRKVRADIRKHHRAIEDNRDELIKPNDLLLKHLQAQDRLMTKVKQTADAALDSRLMVLASDLAGKKLNNSLHGKTGIGIDIDQFVSKCIHFMRSGGSATDDDQDSSAQARTRRRAEPRDEDEEEEDVGDGLDWALLGREACFPGNKRPPVSSFLLGPLSVQKRVRATQSRRARSQRQPVGPATRPQEIQQSDIQQSENSNLTHLVKGIKKRLEEHITDGEKQVDDELSEYGEQTVTGEDFEAACRRNRLEQTPDGESCVSLFDFVINPKSFGQTVENIFYVSFLIREGNAKVLTDKDGLPLLMPCAPRKVSEQREQHVQKHQAVFSIDWPTWKTLIHAFNIKKPLIPHRIHEEANVSAGGWYG